MSNIQDIACTLSYARAATAQDKHRQLEELCGFELPTPEEFKYSLVLPYLLSEFGRVMP